MDRRLLLTALLTLAGLPTTGQRFSNCPTDPGHIEATSVPRNVYGRPVAVTIYLPPCYSVNLPASYPVIYLLHGGAADETQWPDLDVQSAAEKLIGQGAPPFVVVMPGASYSDSIDYGAFVLNDLLPAIRSRYRVKTKRSGQAIGGLSLGGYWALKIAFLHPDLFAAVGGDSPVVSRGYADDPLPLARQAGPQTLGGLQIALDAGDGDWLRYDTEKLAQALRKRGLFVALVIGRGGHNRPYWRAHTYGYLSFYLEAIAPAVDRGCIYNHTSNRRC